MQDELYQMKEDYIREILKLYREKGLSKESVAMLDMMIHSAKNLCKIVESFEDDGYSMGPNMPHGTMSYARGRGSNAHRDSMGRYSSRSYSMHDDIKAELYDLMNRTSDESTRREIQDMVNHM